MYYVYDFIIIIIIIIIIITIIITTIHRHACFWPTLVERFQPFLAMIVRTATFSNRYLF